MRGTRVKTRKSRAKVVSRGRWGDEGGRLGDFWLGVMARSMERGREGGRSNGETVKFYCVDLLVRRETFS